MKAIDRNQLRERLIDCGYGFVPEAVLEQTVDNLLNLEKLENPAAYEMLAEWMETTKLRKFAPIEGIDQKFLKEKLKMREPAIILAYGMLLHDPKRNALFLKRQVDKRNLFKPENKG